MEVYFETYGCAANQAHTEVMKGLLSRAGCGITESEELADVLILNSCIVKSPTENRIIHRLKELQEEHPEKGLIVAGCMPQAEHDRTLEFAPKASFVGPDNCRDIVKAVDKTAKGERVEYLESRREDKLCLPRLRQNPLIDICEIAQGCLGNCSYCQVRLAKGELKSYGPDKILKEIRQSLGTGCKEIWITSQDTASYGRDIGTGLSSLLEQIVKLPGRFRVRVGMMNADAALPILDELVEVFKDDKIYSFLHLPLQSGSDKVLKGMRRKYRVEDFKDVVKSFRKEIPGLNFWTDVIVGFPGETEEDLGETKKVIKELRPDFVNVSRYGARPGTDAKEMEQIPPEVKKNRSEGLSELTRKITEDRTKKLEGREVEALITERGSEKDQWKGRDDSYRPVLVDSKENLLGKFVDCEVEETVKNHLFCKRK